MAHGEKREEQILARIERRLRWPAPKLAVRLALVFGVLLVGAALISPHEHTHGTAAVLWGASVTWHHAHLISPVCSARAERAAWAAAPATGKQG